MTCDKCGCEKFKVLNVYRNRIRKDGEWVFAPNRDTRIVLCDDCGSRYYEESSLTMEILYCEHTMKKIEKNVS